MAETFLVNINCKKVLGDSDVSQYTMFIDSSKMSIVYELVEWIRWMFSLETCFYIKHNNSIIHELEDIQLLSRLQNFELMPCGLTNCIHKRMYRTLLKNLNLFVSWNGIEVHKHFMHKLNQMDQNLTQETNTASPRIHTSGPGGSQNLLVYKDKKFEHTKNINFDSSVFLLHENSQPVDNKESVPLVKTSTLIGKAEAKWDGINGSSTEMNSFIDKNLKSNKNLSNSENTISYVNEVTQAGCEGTRLETEKRIKGGLVNASPIKDKLKTVQESSNSFLKPHSKKYVKPFSLGEILSTMREEFEKQKTEPKMKRSSSCSSLLKEGDLDNKMMTKQNSFATEIKTSGGKKRQRTRRRRKAKKENVNEFIAQFFDKSIVDCSLEIPQSNGGSKPSHIRFDSDEEDSLMEMEYVGDNLQIENQTKCDSISRELSETNGFSQNESKELLSMMTDNDGIVYKVNNTENKMQCSVSGQFPAEEKLLIQNNSKLEIPEFDKTDQPYGANENFESKNFSPDLNTLLSLKEKFKNAIVIERFY